MLRDCMHFLLPASVYCAEACPHTLSTWILGRGTTLSCMLVLICVLDELKGFATLRRDRGETRLVRVDICSTKGGVLIVNMSHQAAGFAPYRLDNCSPEVLHVR